MQYKSSTASLIYLFFNWFSGSTWDIITVHLHRPPKPCLQLNPDAPFIFLRAAFLQLIIDLLYMLDCQSKVH